MRAIAYLLITVVLLGVSGVSAAGTVEGRVVFVQVGHGYTPDNVFALVKFDTTINARPACATDTVRMAINPATEAGKAMLSLVLAAKAAGMVIEAVGTDNCDVMGSEQESISYLFLKD